ncbi:MAG: HAD hydrolase family protein, partial [Clostridia bacterium]|nr:HAD hydrolase family protein [Clostridia bacterium]
TMLEEAGLSLAVQNAKDSVKTMADEIICSCDQNIMKYVFGRYYK